MTTFEQLKENIKVLTNEEAKKHIKTLYEYNQITFDEVLNIAKLL